MNPAETRRSLEEIRSKFPKIEGLLEVLRAGNPADFAEINRATFYRWLRDDNPPERARAALLLLQEHLGLRGRLKVATPGNFWCLPVLRLIEKEESGRFIMEVGGLHAEIVPVPTGRIAGEKLQSGQVHVALGARQWVGAGSPESRRLCRVCRAPLHGLSRVQIQQMSDLKSLRVGYPQSTTVIREIRKSGTPIRRVQIPIYPEETFASRIAERLLVNQEDDEAIDIFVAWEPIISRVRALLESSGGLPKRRRECHEVTSGLLGYLETHIGVNIASVGQTPSVAHSIHKLLLRLNESCESMRELQRMMAESPDSPALAARLRSYAILNRILGIAEDTPSEDLVTTWSKSMKGCAYEIANYDTSTLMDLWGHSARLQ